MFDDVLFQIELILVVQFPLILSMWRKCPSIDGALSFTGFAHREKKARQRRDSAIYLDVGVTLHGFAGTIDIAIDFLALGDFILGIFFLDPEFDDDQWELPQFN